MLLAFAAVLLCLMVLTGIALLACWEAIHAGQPLWSGIYSLLSVVLGLIICVLVDVLLSAPPPPDGVCLPRAAAGDFYRLLDHLAGRLGIEPIREVFVTGDMNAQIMQRPAWGLCGPLRTHLLLGLPLIHSLSAPQLAAVLAHELAHVAAQRQGWSALGAYVRAWWARILERAAIRFEYIEDWVDRGSDHYCERMLRLARMEEFEADALAAELVGKELMGEALIEVSLKACFLEHDYWPRIQARTQIRPYREMGFGFEAGFVRRATAPEADLSEERARLSFHPSLRERLAALGTPMRMPTHDSPSAAQRYFGPLLPTLAWVFDRAWSDDLGRSQFD